MATKKKSVKKPVKKKAPVKKVFVAKLSVKPSLPTIVLRIILEPARGLRVAATETKTDASLPIKVEVDTLSDEKSDDAPNALDDEDVGTF